MRDVTQFDDLARTTPTRELFIVEGDSAARAVTRLRDPESQAVLAMQGKPLNAHRAALKKVRENHYFNALSESLGLPPGTQDVSHRRIETIILLMDPDADGIHCSVLMLGFFLRWMPKLLECHAVHMIRPPLFEITACSHRDEVIYANSEAQQKRITEAFQNAGVDHKSRRFRGLAGIPDDVLRETCIDPRTRASEVYSREDAEYAISFFK
ncbi:MAG: toprim domain-containing protein [Planctomycetota bacterium]